MVSKTQNLKIKIFIAILAVKMQTYILVRYLLLKHCGSNVLASYDCVITSAHQKSP